MKPSVRQVSVRAVVVCSMILVAGAADAKVAKKQASSNDNVADMIAKSRNEAQTESSGLNEVLGETRLVAKADDASAAAAAVMAGSEEAEAAALSGSSQKNDQTSGASSEDTLGKSVEMNEAAGEDASASAATAPVQDVAKMQEKEIPVLTAAPKQARSSESAMQRMLISAGVLLVLAAGAFFGLKRWSRKSQGRNSNTRIKVLTQHYIGPKKSVAIIQVAGESILVGVTDHSITMLKTLALLDEEIPESTPNHFDSAMADFEDEEQLAEERAQERRREQSREQRRGGSVARDADDFALRGLSEIRDTVSKRLKGFKHL